MALDVVAVAGDHAGPRVPVAKARVPLGLRGAGRIDPGERQPADNGHGQGGQADRGGNVADGDGQPEAETQVAEESLVAALDEALGQAPAIGARREEHATRSRRFQRIDHFGGAALERALEPGAIDDRRAPDDLGDVGDLVDGVPTPGDAQPEVGAADAERIHLPVQFHEN